METPGFLAIRNAIRANDATAVHAALATHGWPDDQWRLWQAALPIYRHDALRALAAAGGDVDTQGTAGTPLYMSALWEDLPTVKVLLEVGADPNSQTSRGRTPLHAAALGECVQEVEILLQAGADPSIVDEDGNTPLMIAKRKDRTAIVAALRPRKIP